MDSNYKLGCLLSGTKASHSAGVYTVRYFSLQTAGMSPFRGRMMDSAMDPLQIGAHASAHRE